MPLNWQTGLMVPVLMNDMSNYGGLTLFSIPGMVYARVLERSRCRRNNVIFILVVENWASYLSSWGYFIMGAFPTRAHVFCGLGKSIQPRSMGYCVSCALGLGVFGLLVGALALYNHCKSFVHITGNKSNSFTVEVRLNQGWSLFIIFIDRISRQSPSLWRSQEWHLSCCRWCGSAGIICWWCPSVYTESVCSTV